MILCDSVRKSGIRSHYDLATPFYRLLWGPHIHHGLWEDATPSAGDASPLDAQLHLTNTLADLANVSRGSRVLDVGCGMGGSSIHLARSRDCRVVGVTLSGVQRRWATTSAWWQGLSRSVEFRRTDIEQESFSPATFDVVWSIECTEHLADKRAFFANAASWIPPLFLKHFSTLLNAYRSGAMQYGCFVAHRPPDALS